MSYLILPMRMNYTQSCRRASPNVEKNGNKSIYICRVMTIDDVVFDKTFLTIYHLSEESLIHLQWKGYTTSDQFREGLNVALDLVRENHIENWLGNLKLMQVILSSDEEWTNTEWFPQIAQTTLKRMAIVTSLDFFNNTAVKRIVEKAEPTINFETRYFVDVKDAHDWLTNTI
jgi:hypothetical protein